MIKEALAEFARAQQRPWKHDRTKTVGSSEVGQCIKKTAFVKKRVVESTRGKKRPPADLTGWGAAMRGTIIENAFWYPALKKKYGDKLKMAGPRHQETLFDGLLSATPDGLITDLPRDALTYLGIPDIGPSRCVAIECKSIDPRVPLREAKEVNVFQVHVATGLIRKKTQYKPDYAVISYTDASFWDEVTEFAVKFDPEVYAAAEQRARAALTEDTKDLRPEGYIAGGQECDWCDFVKQCGVERRSVPVLDVEADPQFAAEIADMCRELLAAKARNKEGEATVKLLEDDIKNRLREKKIRRIPGVVTWSSVKGRASFDNKAIKAKLEDLGIDIGEYETVGEPTDRLQVIL